MAPIVEAILLVSDVRRESEGFASLLGIYPPSLSFREFPTDVLQLAVYVRLREIQSSSDAEKLEIVCTHGLEGKEWGRQRLYESGELLGVPAPPLHTFSKALFLPGPRVREPCVLVFRVTHEGRELARSTLEIFHT